MLDVDTNSLDVVYRIQLKQESDILETPQGKLVTVHLGKTRLQQLGQMIEAALALEVTRPREDEAGADQGN